MSIATAITAAQGRVADCYTAISNKGGTLPATQNLANMPTAIGSIPSGSTPTLITKTITQNGTYNASSDNADGYSSVTVNVSGGSGYTELPNYQVSNGVASKRSKVLDGTEFSNITSVADYGLYYAFRDCPGLTGQLNLSSLTTVGNYGLNYAFYNCSGLTSIDLSSLTSVDSYGLYYAFYNCSGLTGQLNLSSLASVGSNGLNNAFRSCKGLTSIDLSSLTSVDSYGLNNAFNSCKGLTSIDLSSLASVGSNGLNNAFMGCIGLTSVDLSSLTSVGSNGLQYVFDSCTGLTSVDLSSLTTVGSSGLYYAFRGCTGLTDIYFNSLTTTSFGSYKNQFNNMLSSTRTSVTHTLHFPSNLQTTISGLAGYPNFGGASGYVTLSFDLPATS